MALVVDTRFLSIHEIGEAPSLAVSLCDIKTGTGLQLVISMPVVSHRTTRLLNYGSLCGACLYLRKKHNGMIRGQV